MKFNVTVECTPEEARRFVGLPDVTPLNDAMVKEMTARMEANMAMMSPDAMMRSWMAIGGQAQEAMMTMMTSAAGAATKSLKGG